LYRPATTWKQLHPSPLAASERSPRGTASSSDQIGHTMVDASGFHCTFLVNQLPWIGRGPVRRSCLVGPRNGASGSKYFANKMILNNISRVDTTTKQFLTTGLVGRALDEEIRAVAPWAWPDRPALRSR
jgi:hypothetical protein